MGMQVHGWYLRCAPDPSPAPAGKMTSMAITMKLPEGVTYRQFRYWLDQGYLPHALGEGSAPGGRKSRTDEWTADEWRTLTLVGYLRLSGMEAPLAGAVATEAQGRRHGMIRVQVKPGVVVTVSLDEVYAASPDTNPNGSAVA